MKATTVKIESFLEGNPKYDRVTFVKTSNYSNDVHIKRSKIDGSKEYLSSKKYDIPPLKPFLYVKKKVYDKLCKKHENFDRILTQNSIIQTNLLTHFGDNKPSSRMLEGYNVMFSSEKLTIKKLKEFMESMGIPSTLVDEQGNVLLFDDDGNRVNYNPDGSITLIDANNQEVKTIIAEKVDKVKKSTKRTTDYICLSSDEQYLIQNRIKMFKGIESVKDLHTAVVDIETAPNPELGEEGSALDYNKGFIFQIGLRDNKGFKKIFTCNEYGSGEELEIIKDFFDTLLDLQPDNLIYHYGEFFDLWMMLGRGSILGLDEDTLKMNIVNYYQKIWNIKLYGNEAFNRYPKTLKVGGQMETKMQTNIFGINCIDTIDSVKRAAELDRTIPNNRLKDNVKHIGKEKKNRVYVKGDEISNLFFDKRPYLYNKQTGDYFLFEKSDKEGYVVSKGAEIEEQYLVDDLDETLELFFHYNEAPFLLNKWLPISFQSACVAGGAATWSKLYYAWAYDNEIAIPLGDKKRKYLGGLVGMLKSGYMLEGGKLDFASLYPSLYLEYVVELLEHMGSTHDITDFFPVFLKYSCDERNKYKKLTNEYKKEGNKEMATKYGAIQLPFKINNNAFYGSLAFFLNNLSHIDSAEAITCFGRFWDRHLYTFFTEIGLEIMYCHTDSVHFIFTDRFNTDYEYTGLGKNSLVKKDKLYKGLEAYVAEYNDLYMVGYMGLDIDEVFEACINFSKSNYMTIEKGKIKTVGNTAKTKSKANYIAESMNAIKDVILVGDGDSFNRLYLDKASKIIQNEMTWETLSQASKINMPQKTYEQSYIFETDINGRLNKRMVHHEIVKAKEMRVGVGNRINYINVGTSDKDLNFTMSPTKIGYIKFETELEENKYIDTTKELYDKKKLKKDYFFDNEELVLSINRDIKTKLIDDIVYKKFEEVDEYIDYLLSEEMIEVGGKNKRMILENVFKKDSVNYQDLIKKKIKLKEGVYSKSYINYIHDVKEWGGLRFKSKEDRLEIYYTKPILNCELVTDENKDNTGGYNIQKYIKKFNSALEPFLVVFKPETRAKFLVSTVEELKERLNLKLDLEFISGVPYKKYIQQTPKALVTTTKEERDFFRKVGVSPHYGIDKIKFNPNEPLEYKGVTYKQGHEVVDVILNQPLNIELYGFKYHNYGYKLELQNGNLVLHWGYHNRIQTFDKKTGYHNKYVKFPKRTNNKTDTPLLNEMDRMLKVIKELDFDYYQKCLVIREKDIIETYGEL